MRITNRWMNVPSIDPDDARRRRLLNILLMGMSTLTLLTLLATSVANVTGIISLDEATRLIYLGSLALLVGILIIFAINHYWSGWLASLFFLLLPCLLLFSQTSLLCLLLMF